ncbi:MAG TPA: response regulator [Thermoanaerobaculia bacterium]|nr:response regulator [Thermoanaerobaculia bacterium]
MTPEDAGLTGRSIALVGLESSQLLLVSAALEAAGGTCQAFGRTPEPAKLRDADVVVTGGATAALAATAGVPLLVIGQVALEAPHDFVLPPIRSDEVIVRVTRLLDRRPPRLLTATGMPVVLTADADPATTAIVRAVVTQNGMSCHVARDGKTAFDLARELMPSAIVLDVNMPIRNGFEVLSALRGEPRTASIPVLMLTSVQQEADVVKGFRLGADDYVAKPFNPMELLARIKRLVRRA